MFRIEIIEVHKIEIVEKVFNLQNVQKVFNSESARFRIAMITNCYMAQIYVSTFDTS